MTYNLDSVDFHILRLCRTGTTLAKAKQLAVTKFSNVFSSLPEKALYHRLYRRITRLVDLNLLKIEDPNSRPHIYVTTPTGLDLLTAGAKLKPTAKSAKTIPIRASEERKNAVRLLTTFRMLNAETRELVNEQFDDYMTFTRQKVIILRKNPEMLSPNEFIPDYKVLPYTTRFTDPTRLKWQIKQYHMIYESIPPQFKKAVHLVLTTDPNRFSSLWEANRHFSKAFNRFMSRLRKTFRERPLYLAAYEYTKSGLLHAHVLLFGRSFLLPKRKITAIWEDCGQGTYNWIYSLRRSGNRWIYARQKPKDLKKGEDATDYLKKYLIKALYDKKAASLYWAFNKRFYTFSYRLKTWKPVKIPSLGLYEFYMSCFDWDIPLAVIDAHTDFKPPPPTPLLSSSNA